ncbi:MAG: AhpC/TSA family protein, partial [Planctomycetota bacterium]
MSRKKVGDTVEIGELESVVGAALSLPPSSGVLHLQFRRYSGCPVCNLHLRSFVTRHDELVARGV